NHVRPHEALAMQTPSDVYRPSQRRLMRALVGGFASGTEIVRLGANGRFWFEGRHHVFVSSALAGLQIGLERLDGGRTNVWYHHLLIGYLQVGPTVGRHVTGQPFTPAVASAKGGDPPGDTVNQPSTEVSPPGASAWPPRAAQ